MNISNLEKKLKYQYTKNIINSNVNDENLKDKLKIYLNSLDNLDSKISINSSMPILLKSKNDQNELKLFDRNSDSDNKSTSIEKQNLKISSEEEYSDDYLYKKPWSKLANIHKIIKMKEYVNKLLINNNEDRERLKETLAKLINKKILTKKDMVIYDVHNGRITSIPKLVYKEGKYYVDLT